MDVDSLKKYKNYYLTINSSISNTIKVDNVKLDNDIEYIEIFNKIIAQNDINIKMIDNLLNKLCHHEFVNDYIDTFEDKSIPITYCKICEITL